MVKLRKAAKLRLVAVFLTVAAVSGAHAASPATGRTTALTADGDPGTRLNVQMLIVRYLLDHRPPGPR